MSAALPMKQLLTCMFKGWILYERSYEQVLDTAPLRATRSPEDAMIEACDGDALAGQLLHLFSHWANDVESLAANYGVGLARRQPDGSLLYADGTIDTLMKGGNLEIVEIPPAPSPEHYWSKGAWQAPPVERFDIPGARNA